MKGIEGWSEKKLSELAEYINGYAFKPDDWGEDGLPIIRIEQLKNPSELTDYFSGKIPQKNIIENGDLIFSWSASLFLRIWQHGRAALNQHLFKVIEKEGVDRVFLKLFIEFYLPELTKASHGSTMQHITRKELDRFRAPFPTSKFEQAKIAEILSMVDKAIEQTEELIAKQKRIKTGMMQDLLTRGIDEQGNLRSEETHEFKDSTLGRIPMDWEVKPLSAIIEIIDCKHHTPAYIEDGIPIIRPRNIKDNGFDLSDLDYVTEKDYAMLTEKHEPTDGDIIFSRNASFGIPVYVEGMGRFCIGQDVVVMRKKTVDTRYVFFSLKSDKVVRQIMNVSGGSTFGRIDLGAIRELKIPVPKDECEQHKIAVRLLKCDKAIEIAAHNLMKLRSLKTGLMQDLLTGKKRVTALLDEKEVAGV